MNFLLSFYSHFFLVLFDYKKTKKNSVAGLFLCAISTAGSFQCWLVSALFVPGIHFQWIENFKAGSSGYVGKLN